MNIYIYEYSRWSPMNSAFIPQPVTETEKKTWLYGLYGLALLGHTSSRNNVNDLGEGPTVQCRNIKQTSREGRPPHNWKRAQEGNSSTLKFWSSRSSCSPGMEKTKISRVRRLNALVPGCLVDQVHSGWIWKSWSKLAILRCPEPRQRKDHIERLVWRYVTLQLRRRQSPFGGESLRTPPRPTLGWC